MWDLMLSNTSNFMRYARVLGARRGSNGGDSTGRCLSAMARPVSVVSDASDGIRPVRHLDHHHFKQASMRSSVMQPDLESAKQAAKAHAMLQAIAVDGGMRPTRPSVQVGAANVAPVACRTHQLTLSPAHGGFEQISCPLKVDVGAVPVAKPATGSALLSTATCADAMLAKVPPCKRSVRSDRCDTGG